MLLCKLVGVGDGQLVNGSRGVVERFDTSEGLIEPLELLIKKTMEEAQEEAKRLGDSPADKKSVEELLNAGTRKCSLWERQINDIREKVKRGRIAVFHL